MDADDPVSTGLNADDDVLAKEWRRLQTTLAERFGESIGIEGILFLIGVQESGLGFHPKLRKERKQDLIMHGTHCVMEVLGIYGRVVSGNDLEVSWERRVNLPELSVEEQEKLLRVAIIRYFSDRVDLSVSSHSQS